MFDLPKFKSDAYELKDAIKGGIYAAIGGVTALIFYERPMISLLAWVYWQAVCCYPSLLPSCAPLLVLGILHADYAAHRRRLQGVLAPPTFVQLCRTLLLPTVLGRVPRAPVSYPATQPLPTQTELVKERELKEQREAAAALRTAAATKQLERRVRKLYLARHRAEQVAGAVHGVTDAVSDVAHGVTSVGEEAVNNLLEAGDLVKEGKVLTGGVAAFTKTVRERRARGQESHSPLPDPRGASEHALLCACTASAREACERPRVP